MLLLLLSPYHKTRTTLSATPRALIPMFKALGHWVSSPTTTAGSLCPTTPSYLPAPFLASPDCALCLNAPFWTSSARALLFNLRKLLPYQGSLTGPLSGEPESLSPTLPRASGAFRHPSIYSPSSQVPLDTLLGGREGPQAGRAGSVTCLGEGLGFSRTTPVA